MNQVTMTDMMGGGFVGFVLLMGLAQLGWYVAVIVFLYKIWQKVKHLPAS